MPELGGVYVFDVDVDGDIAGDIISGDGHGDKSGSQVLDPERGGRSKGNETKRDEDDYL